MYSFFAGPVFTSEDTPELLLALGIAAVIVLIPISMVIWGLLGLRKQDKPARNKRITFLVIGLCLLLALQSQFNLFGWMLR